ncbi:hypothetical protein AB0O52_17615 [Arthrobacter sp. NPDC080073]|uniref:hypothetical protein n=1 Tax=Arthrobacter sp. NPDC080073 TaxID=3155919 RepID=UPI0034402349
MHFAPGDELPEWAEGLVGKHCLVPEVGTDASDFTDGGADGESSSEGADSDPADDAGKGDGEGDDVDPAAKTDAPDFTAPAARRGRPRKA